jgi:hypothetical protein
MILSNVFLSVSKSLIMETVTPFMVFDGKRTTGKLVSAERAKARHEARQTALKLHAAGDKVGAEKWAKQAISVTQSNWSTM